MTGTVPNPDASVTFGARAEQYAIDVVEGRIVACRYVKAACQRHLDDLRRAGSDPDFPFVFDLEAAGRPCHFIQLLPHIKGEWARPVVVDGRIERSYIELEGWQIFFVAVLFGWLHRETRRRRFRRAYLEVARKNAKSTLAAGLALYMLGADQEPGAEVYSAATKKDQAKIVWEVAKQMVEREPDFRSLGIETNMRAIVQPDSASKYEPLGRDSDSLDGLNTHCFISDELHAQKDRGIYDVLDSSTGARSQPLGIGITTAGYDQAGVCFEQRAYVIRILNTTLLAHGGMGYRIDGDAIIDDTYFGLIYTLDHGYADPEIPADCADQQGWLKQNRVPDDDWADSSIWIKANPNLGVSVSIDDMEAKATKAKVSAQSQPEFRTKHCNQWLAADSAWMDMGKLAACIDSSLSDEQFLAECCYSALDAAFKTDLFAKVKVFRRDFDDGDHYYAFCECWIPESQVDVEENPHLAAWAQQGLIEVSPGEVIDIESVRESLKRDMQRHDVREIPYDPAQLTQFSAEMLEIGAPMVELRPLVLNFSEPMKYIEELVRTGRFHYDGNPVLTWALGNVVCHRDAKDNIYPNKIKGQESKRKIDPAIALIMGIARARLRSGPMTLQEDHVFA